MQLICMSTLAIKELGFFISKEYLPSVKIYFCFRLDSVSGFINKNPVVKLLAKAKEFTL